MSNSPYAVLSNDYWKQPRHICVVDEINCLKSENAEIKVFPPCDQELSWIRRIAATIGAETIVLDGTDDYGRSTIIVRRHD